MYKSVNIRVRFDPYRQGHFPKTKNRLVFNPFAPLEP